METIQLNQLNLKPHQSILDLGCGEGRHTISAGLYDGINIYYLDINIKDLKEAKNKISNFFEVPISSLAIEGSGLSLPFSDESFDHIICSEVLEHIHGLEQIVKEINRVLKPGGSLAISVPRFWPEKICWLLSHAYHEVKGGHIRIFKESKIKQLFVDNFDLRHKHWAHALHSPYWWLRCAFWSKGEDMRLIRLYHKLLVWDLMKRPWITRILEKCLNPIMGKSLVLYFVKR